MKLILCSLGLVFALCSCAPTLKMPEFTKRSPDVLLKDTDVVLNETSSVVLTRGTDIQTSESQIEAILAEDIKSQIDTKTVEIAKNTKITIPPNTRLILSEPISVKLESGSEISLKSGTEITVTRFNWYALLFYLLLIGLAGWWFVKDRRSSKQSKLLNE